MFTPKNNQSNFTGLPVELLYKIFPDTYAQISSNGVWIPHRHLVFMLRRLAAGIMRGNYRAIVNMPAAYGKTWSLKWLIIWFMEFNVRRKVIYTGYNDVMVNSISREIRDEIKNNQKIGVKISGGSNKINDFMTSTLSTFWAQPARGTLTSKHFHLGIIDDPIKDWNDALSQLFLDKWKKWYFSVFNKRCLPGGSQILNMTRWVEDDPSGFLLKEMPGVWDHICFPKIATGGDILGRKKGEALCPTLFDQKSVENEKAITPAIIWEAMDQQNPTAIEGNIIKNVWWQYWTELPTRFDELIISADLNMSEGLENDRTAYVVMGRRGSSVYIVHVEKGIYDFDKQIPMFVDLVKMFPKTGAKLVENKANGPALESVLKRRVPGIKLVEPEGGKFARVMAVLGMWSAKNVFVPKDENKYPWVKEYLTEHANFPNGRYDDQVDATSQGLVHFQRAIQSGLSFYTGGETMRVPRKI